VSIIGRQGASNLGDFNFEAFIATGVFDNSFNLGWNFLAERACDSINTDLVMLKIAWNLLGWFKIPGRIPCVVGIVWVVRVIIIKIVVEAIIKTISGPVSAGIPVDVLSVVAKRRCVLALISALPSVPIVIYLRFECSLSTSAHHILASPIRNVGAVLHHLSTVASPSVVSPGAVLEASVDATIHTLLAHILVNNPIVLADCVCGVAVLKAGCLSGDCKSKETYKSDSEGRISGHILY